MRGSKALKKWGSGGRAAWRGCGWRGRRGRRGDSWSKVGQSHELRAQGMALQEESSFAYSPLCAYPLQEVAVQSRGVLCIWKAPSTDRAPPSGSASSWRRWKLRALSCPRAHTPHGRSGLLPETRLYLRDEETHIILNSTL